MYVGPDGQELRTLDLPIFLKGSFLQIYLSKRLLVQNFIAIPIPCFPAKCGHDSGGLDEALWFSADLDLLAPLGAMGPVRFIPETLSAFRIHPASQTAGPESITERMGTATENGTYPPPAKLASYREVAYIGRAGCQWHRSREFPPYRPGSRGEHVKPAAILHGCWRLVLPGGNRYLRDSRIVQRVKSRLKLQRLAKLEKHLANDDLVSS